MKKRYILKIVFCIISILFINMPRCYAIFKHTSSVLFKIKSNGIAPTCELSTNNYVNSSLDIVFSTATGYTTQYKTITMTDFANVPAISNVPILNVLENDDIEMRYINDLGVTSATSICKVENIDKINPSLTFNPNSNGTYVKEVSSIISAVDNIGISTIYYKFTQDNMNAPTTGWTEVAGNLSTNQNISALSNGETGKYYLWAKVVDRAGNAYTKVSGEFFLDNLPPTINVEPPTPSSSNISLEVESSDSNSGILGYYYSIDNGATWTTIQTTGIYVFTNLNALTSYSLKVKVEDKVGNIAISNTINVTTDDLGSITLSVDAVTWTQSKTLSVSNSQIEGENYYYRIAGESTWTEILTTNFEHKFYENTSVEFKITDGYNEKISTFNITKIDPIPVTINSLTAPNEKIRPKSIVLEVSAIDTGLDPERSEIKGYQYSCDNGSTYTGLTSSTYTCKDLLINTEYTLYVKVYDNAGNVTLRSVVARTKEINNVFLSGSGLDSNDGNSPSEAVKTFSKAKSLLKKGGTIWITDKVNVTSAETWNLADYGVYEGEYGIIKRWDGVSVEFSESADKVAYTGILINVNANTTLSLLNMIFDGNKANITGNTSSMITTIGNIYAENTEMINNRAAVTGVVINSRISTTNRPTITIKNSLISGNDGAYFGSANGTIAYDKGNVIIDNSTFENNINYNGGPITSAYKSGIIDRTLNITNSIFRNNDSGVTGTISIAPYDTASITNTQITNNQGYNGGGIYLLGSSLSLENSNVNNNESTIGGGIYVRSGSGNIASLNIISSNIKANSSTANGAGMYIYSGVVNIEGTNEIIDNTDSDTLGDIYNYGNITLGVTGELINSRIGIWTRVKPASSASFDIAVPIGDYVLPNNVSSQFISNDSQYKIENAIYNTTNNKIILKNIN